MAGEDGSKMMARGRAPPPATSAAQAELTPLRARELCCNRRTKDAEEAHIAEAMASQVLQEQDGELSRSILSPKVGSGRTELPMAEVQAAVGGQSRSVKGPFGSSIPDFSMIADTESSRPDR